jgi:hypothetical protein
MGSHEDGEEKQGTCTGSTQTFSYDFPGRKKASLQRRKRKGKENHPSCPIFHFAVE